MAIDSEELQQVVAEAEDIARNVTQRLSTAHLLLAMFTFDNQADRLLRERGLTEDEVLALLTRGGKAPEEQEGTVAQALARARQLADDCVHAETDALHLLVALSRLPRATAQGLLERAAAPLANLRTAALARLTGPLRKRAVRTEAQLEPSRAQLQPQRQTLAPLPSRSAIGSLGPSPLAAPSHGPRTAVAEALPSSARGEAGQELLREPRVLSFGAPELRDELPRHSRLGEALAAR